MAKKQLGKTARKRIKESLVSQPNPNIEVGKEYIYLGQFVKVLDVRPGANGTEVLFETRFADTSTCDAEELSEKAPLPTIQRTTDL